MTSKGYFFKLGFPELLENAWFRGKHWRMNDSDKPFCLDGFVVCRNCLYISDMGTTAQGPWQTETGIICSAITGWGWTRHSPAPFASQGTVSPRTGGEQRPLGGHCWERGVGTNSGNRGLHSQGYWMWLHVPGRQVSFSRGSETTMLRVEAQMYLDGIPVFQH